MDADNLEKLDAVIGAMTPGPWEPCPMDMYVLGGDGHFVAEVRGFGAEVSGQRPEGTQRANARGIATLRNVAPELLAVARAVTDSDTIAALMLSDHPHASDCARALVAALDDLRAKAAEVLL